MNKRMPLLLLLVLLLGSVPASADQIAVQLQLRLPQGTPLYTATAYVSDAATEFTPYGQLSFDFTGAGDIVFHPLVSAKFISYDAVFIITSPHYWFSAVSALSPATGLYSSNYDPANRAIVFHHFQGYDTPATVLQFEAEIQHAPEPSSLLLLGTGLIFTAGLLRRRLR